MLALDGRARLAWGQTGRWSVREACRADVQARRLL